MSKRRYVESSVNKSGLMSDLTARDTAVGRRTGSENWIKYQSLAVFGLHFITRVCESNAINAKQTSFRTHFNYTFNPPYGSQ